MMEWKHPELLKKYLKFYLDLYEGRQAPKTEDQKIFLNNVHRGKETNEQESAFIKWLALNPSRRIYKKSPPTVRKGESGFSTPDDMKGGFVPEKLTAKEPPAPLDKGRRGVKAHGDPKRRRANRRKDRYGRPTDQ
jgi:uncharacterized protein YifE (UPF0438 family)